MIGPRPEAGVWRDCRVPLPRWPCAATAVAFVLLVGVGCERSGERSSRQSAPAQVIPSPRAERESFRRLTQDEVTPALEARAQQILDAHLDAPYGTHVDFSLDGKGYRAILEQHYRPPGEEGPDGHHKGVTLYVAQTD